MNKFRLWVFCALAPAGFAQVGGYLGPGVLSNGAGTIGTRSGEQVNLRFYADVDGVYDTGLQPYAVDSKGNLINVGGLFGEQVDLGAYGTHSWKTALLGLDYTGNFYNYQNAPQYDGILQNMVLGFTWQKSRHLSFDFRQIGGLSNLNFASPVYNGVPSNFVATPTSSLFDSPFYYFQSSVDVNYIASVRTVYTFGGDAFWVRREGFGLASLNGWNARGSIQHRLSRTETIGVTYERIHMDFSPSFGASDINVAQGFFSTAFGRRWTFALYAGAMQTEVSGIQQVAVSPVLAALLGSSYAARAFYLEDIYPTGDLNLTGKFKNSIFTLHGSDEIAPGNGVYLTSRMEQGTLNYSYTGIKKWNFGVSGGYYNLIAIGQNLQNFGTWNGGAGVTYSLPHSFHLIARFDARDQQISIVGYKNHGYRSTLGIGWSPGDLPLSLW